ncbi:MAG: VOC family protein [Opitutaceae bacterium]
MKISETLTQATGLFHPGIVTARFVETCEFYFEHFAFTPEHVDPDGALLAGPRDEHLMLLRAANPAQPAALRTPNRGSGMWLQLVVPDPRSLSVSMAEAGVEIIADLHTGADGRLSFVARDPNGVLIHITEPPARVYSVSKYQPSNNHDQNHRIPIHRLSGH